MKDLFVPYELAVRLKEKGFNEPCLATYHKEYKSIIPVYAKFTDQDVFKAPLWQQVIDWLMEEKKIYMHVDNHFDRLLGYNRGFIPSVNEMFYFNEDNDCFESYYKAFEKGIEKALELI
jgi:hypothetical protein